MERDVEIVKNYYGASVEREWLRLERHPMEFRITTAYLDRYLKPGERVLDIGGGPGRYSLYLAGRGCGVTLLDLSPENTAFAAQKAEELGLPLRTVTGDAREADRLLKKPFDHVLLMGPLYHLLEERDRVRAVEAALALLRPGGLLFASFINLSSGMVYAMKEDPGCVLWQSECEYLSCFLQGRSFAGDGFTRAFFAPPREVRPFFSRFPLEEKHLFGQEGLCSPCEDRLVSQPREVQDQWVKLSLQVCEREEYFAFSEHLMFVGQKRE